METLFRLLLTLHILGGLTALLTGYSAMWVKRGGPRHRQLGQWYVRGMMFVLLTGFPMSFIHPNPFLFGIVFFTAYFVWAGRSAALNRSGQPTGADKLALAIFLGGSAIALMALGWAHFFAPTFNPTFKITGLVFATIAVVVGLRDMMAFRGEAVAGRLRIQRHLVNCVRVSSPPRRQCW